MQKAKLGMTPEAVRLQACCFRCTLLFPLHFHRCVRCFKLVLNDLREPLALWALADHNCLQLDSALKNQRCA
eukprot:1999402-Rhodomonas_salina.1